VISRRGVCDCSGGINYTRRLYHEIATPELTPRARSFFRNGLHAAASHLAALLDVDGQSYTLVETPGLD
jgi:hypothetical protein